MVCLGPGGGTSREIGQGTGTKLHLSGRNDFYPGTQLQELSIRGPGMDPVANAFTQVLTKVIEACGRISGDDPDVPEGHCRVRVVVPHAAAKAIIGRGGENIKALRAESGLHVHIDEVAIGVGETSEQVVRLDGEFMAVQVGVPNIMEKVAEFMDQPWFARWSSESNAGSHHVAAVQMGKGKGKAGCGKPAPVQSALPAAFANQNKGAHVVPAKGYGKAEGKGYGKAEGKNGKGYGKAAADSGGWNSAPARAPPQTQAWATGSPALDMLANALVALPRGASDLRSRGQSVSFTCPEHCVSAVIGKGGVITKEISGATGVKVMIREIEGNAQEKSVTLVGSAPGVAAAYMMVVARIEAVKEKEGSGTQRVPAAFAPRGDELALGGELDGLESAVEDLGGEQVAGEDIDHMFQEMISEEQA